MTLLEELRQLINDHHAHGLRAIDTTTLTQLVHKWSHPSQSVTICDQWDDGQGVYHPGTRLPGVGVGDEFHPVTMPELVRWFRWLSARLRHVRIINGDWSRLVKRGVTHTLSVRTGGVAGVFLDPPYAGDIRAKGLYAEDSYTVAQDVLAWCLTEEAHDPRLRVVLAGFDTEHTELEAAGWTVHEWFTAGWLRGGMGNKGDGGQQHRERLWASPNCLDPTSTPQLFPT